MSNVGLCWKHEEDGKNHGYGVWKCKDKFKEALELEEIHGMEGLEIDLDVWEFFVTWEMMM